jgi:P-type Ca2+ transporter type 2C
MASVLPNDHTTWSQVHASDAAELLHSGNITPEQGLSTERVTLAHERLGWNELQEAPPFPWWRRLLAQFQELVILVLLAAAIISGLLQEWSDALAIIAIVILNGLLGFFQEERAQQALAALRKLSRPLAKAIRNGALCSIPARELVPGDVMCLPTRVC